MIARRAWVSGRVQGVSFRAHTRDEALRLGLLGYVHDLPDGSVEVLACGAPAHVEALMRWLWQGSPASRVEQVEVSEVSVPPPPHGFDVR